MKQIEREGSAQRAICALLGATPGMTIAAIAAARGVHPRAIARQVQALMKEGFVCGAGYPRQYRMTSKPMPAPVASTPQSAVVTRARRREKEATDKPFGIPSVGDLERVVSSWVGS
ncbi:hypothetical protein B0G75_104261 [Paraburkholderia sp. BL18I3N2]|uniref:winged helix-turn-helix domain-containing protein n=1 Tax=Paraburkholderia sp. BL18I3N2 TaxID=1938799 RepID=UPI000D05C5DF|nr:winged helix-turn-helix domain-containing protein [Paraburkholderia sp. BL18I3N2]PRX32240.1 hypothetical protein B0G75_104261 [Paraburkholderia sp. BL18I3N2]